MVSRHWLAPLLTLLLAGCDNFPGPRITNAYGTDLMLTVTYSNGQVSPGLWPACQTLQIGWDDRVHVTHVSIEKDGTVLREFFADEIQTMVQKEDKAESPSQWLIGPEGATLLAGQAPSCGRENQRR